MRRGKRKTKQGVVLSDKMDKTVVVKVERKFRHPFYQKVVCRNTRFKAHDEENRCVTGDLVEIMETKPLSREKRWRVVRILGKGRLSRQELPVKSQKELANLAKARADARASGSESNKELTSDTAAQPA